tara:strand:- start:1225 stop:1671 length:447 start_codon:yes stop_codon:yes gene_type:complete
MKHQDSLPKFTLKDQHGNPVQSEDWIGNTAVLVYFYPKDFTPGCTKEACGFRDAFEDFTERGIKVVGISGDTIDSHKKFANRHQLPFTLLADPDGNVKKLFQVKPSLLGFLPGRESFLFNKQGKLIFKFRSISGSAHVTEALKHIQDS